MFLFHLTKEDRQKIHQILKQYQEDSRVQSMHGFVQHGRTSTYEHCMNVVKLSFWINKHLHLSANERALLAGALLHDFYLYDWHKKSTWHRWHGFSHPSRAWENARRHFSMGAKEENIIRSHMWPLIPWQIPRSREAVIVCLADKCCSLYETTAR